MPAFSFHLNQQPVTISANDAALLAHFAEYFRYYEQAESSSDANALILELHLAEAPTLPLTAEPVAQTGVLSLWRVAAEPEVFQLCAGDTAFVIEPVAGRATSYTGADALAMPPILTNTYSLFALLLLLRWRGVYHLHAAAALAPDDRLFWLVGAQRSGKTTLVTALGLAGWRPLADDSLLWQWQAAQFVGQVINLPYSDVFTWQPLRKAFHLGNEALAHWQLKLNSLSTQPRCLDRRSAAALEFFGSQALAEQSRTRVDGILFPQITDARNTTVSPLAASEALRILAEQSAYFPLWRNHTQSQIAGLSQWLRGAKSYRVMSGADVFDEPERVAELLLHALGD